MDCMEYQVAVLVVHKYYYYKETAAMAQVSNNTALHQAPKSFPPDY